MSNAAARSLPRAVPAARRPGVCGWRTAAGVAVLSWALSLAALAEPVPEVSFEVTAFVVEGDNPMDEAASMAVLDPFRGRYTGLDGLLAAVDALQAALNEAGHAFRRVILPPQTLDGGEVRLRIVPITLASVAVEGNAHFSADNIRRSVPGLAPGMTPRRAELGGALELVNRHPAKQVSVRLRESDKPDAVDAVIDVSDRKPWQVFAGLNDIGTRNSGRTRLTVGGQYSNLFDRDHSITASYTTSPENVSDVTQAGISYDAPLYASNRRVSAFYSDSDVDVGVIDGFEVSGAGRFLGATVTSLLARRGRYAHEWSVGFQDRRFESSINNANLLPGDRLLFADVIRSRPLTLGYSGGYEAERWQGGFALEFSRNMAFGTKNNDRVYGLSRGGADADWHALRLRGSANYWLPRDWMLATSVNAQLATEPLISGEQFGLGGVRSIRGLDEREVVADSGLRAGVELWTPPLPHTLGLRLLGFVDFGYFNRADPEPGEIDDDTITSAGIGARWQWRGLSIEANYGHVLDEGEGIVVGDSDAGGWRGHFSVFYVY